MIQGLIILLTTFGGARAQLSSFPRGFERACLTKPCDDATFFKFFPVDYTSDDNTNIMLHAQYQVCVDFIENLKGGCPEVTKMIAKYPELVNVIVRMSSSRGVRTSIDGRYTMSNYAEGKLRRECMNETFNFENGRAR